MKVTVSKADGLSDIEQLADELSLRDLHVTLAPDGNNELVLEVTNFRPGFMGAAVRAGRVYWRAGARRLRPFQGRADRERARAGEQRGAALPRGDRQGAQDSTTRRSFR